MYSHIDRENPIVAVEIGIWEAANAKRLLDEFPNLTLIGIDPFEGYQDWHMYIQGSYMSEREKIAMETMKPYIESGRFSLIRKYSDKALEELEDGKYDFIYIDADHSYEWAIHDMTNYWEKVKDGGVLCGHDRNLPGVKKALEEFTAIIAKNFTPSEEPQIESWYITK